MPGRFLKLSVLVALLAALGENAAICRAQDAPPPAPVPVPAPSIGTPAPAPSLPSSPAAPGTMPTLPAPVYVPGNPGPMPPPPPGGVVAPPPGGYFPDRNGPLLRGDPLLDRPLSPPPGWFTNIEINLLGPHVSNQLISPVPIAGIVDTVQLPGAPLEWVGSPRIEVGYRMPQGCGEFLVGYQSLVSTGRAIAVDFEGPGNDGGLHSRLNMNVVDFLYGSHEYSLAPGWDLDWRVGARLATIYYDTQAAGVFLRQTESSNFVGAGPIAGLEVARHFATFPPVALFGRLQGALLIGNVHQAFSESVDFTSVGGGVFGGATDHNSTQAVPVLEFQFGVSYTPPWDGRWARFAFGYEFQQYWGIGQAAGSRADLQTNGVFFRAELGF